VPLRVSGEVVIQDSRGTRVSRPRNWRTQVLRLMAAFIAAYAPVQIAFVLRQPWSWGHIVPPTAVLVASLAVALAPRLSDRARAFLLCFPMLATGLLGVYHAGATTWTVLVFTQVTVVLGLVLGARPGVAALLVTAACFGVAGAAGRSTLEPLAWLRLSFTYAVSAGVLLVAVTLAVRRVEQALEDVGQALAQAERLRREREEARAGLAAADERLRLILEAAAVVPWSLHAEGRRFEWGRRGPAAEGAFATPPATLDELLARVPDGDRARVTGAFEAVLARRTPELRLEHALLGDDGAPRWYEVYARLAAIDGHDVLVGIALDATARRRQGERRADAQARLLRLSTSEGLARGDLAAALREITEAGVAILGVDRCAVWMFSDDRRALECLDLCRRGDGHERGARLAVDAYPRYFEAIATQRAVAAHDAHADARTRELAAYLDEHRVTSLLDSPIHVRGRLMGVLCHEHVGPPRHWSPDEELAAGSLADFASRVVEASERAIAERRLHLAYEQLGQVSRRMEAVREEERRVIARELHDELGQTLTAVKLNLALAAREPESAARLAETAAIVDRALRSTRELSRAMRPPLLDEVGLVPALQAFLDEQARYSEVEFKMEAQVPRRPSAEIEIAAFRVVQEAVTNVLRHAAARHVRVHANGGDRLTITVTDDGKGFDVDRVVERAAAGGHLGLVGMRERVRAFGGHFGVRSSPGTGTEVRVELPIGSRGGEA
jgi:signal transduction histidine kinase